MAKESNSRPRIPVGQRIKNTLWLKQIDRANELADRGDRRKPKRIPRDLLGIERPRKDRGIIQGKAHGFHRLTGTVILRDPEVADVNPAGAIGAVLECYALGYSDAATKRAREAQTAYAVSQRTIDAMTDVLRRAAIAKEVRRVKRRAWRD